MDFTTIVDMYNKRRRENGASQSTNIEMELRVRAINKESFMNIVDRYKNKQMTTVDHSINVYKPNTPTGTNTMWVQSFSASSKTVEYINKITIAQLYPTSNVSINISSETELPKFTPPIGSRVRIKKRRSHDMSGGIWRVDLTIVKNTVLDANLRSIKEAIFAMPFDSPSDDGTLTYSVELEHIGQLDLTPNDVQAAYDAIMSLTKDSRQAYIDLIATLADSRVSASFFTFENALNRPVGLTKSIYSEIYNKIGSLLLSDKIDGLHNVLIFKDNQLVILDNIGINISKTVSSKPLPLVVLESEVVGNIHYVMDVLAFGDGAIAKMSYTERLAAIPTIISTIKSAIPASLSIIPKTFIKIESADKLESLVGRFLDAKDRPYDIDGLIFATDLSYGAMTIYKWKPFDKNSIDFYAKRAPKSLLTDKMYASIIAKYSTLGDLYILFSGINRDRMTDLGLTFMDGYSDIIATPSADDRYVNIQFSPAIHPLAYVYFHDTKTHGDVDGKVVELTMTDPKELVWKFLKVRDDKVMGNDYRTAELTYFNYIAPFTREDLYKPNFGYFNVSYGPEEKALYFMSNVIKRKAITKFLRDNIMRYSSWLIDLAAGRGADLRTYISLNVKDVIVFDIDPIAIFNLLSRRYRGGDETDDIILGNHASAKALPTTTVNKTHRFDHVRQPGIHVSKRRGAPNIRQGTTVHAAIVDLSQPHSKTIDEIHKFNSSNNINYIICNFAIHYFCNSVDGITNLLKLVSAVLIKGGAFIFSYMDGRRVFDLLAGKDINEAYEVTMNGRIKYRLERKYKSDELTEIGQLIGVKLPFSSDMVDEYLVNIDFITSVGALMGLRMEKIVCLGDLADMSGASDDDKLYVRLHDICMFIKD